MQGAPILDIRAVISDRAITNDDEARKLAARACGAVCDDADRATLADALATALLVIAVCEDEARTGEARAEVLKIVDEIECGSARS